ncbi:MAG TPA: hypothetical protein VG842_05710, partial [Sediminibacterium sp.]|nr:hypothetical protein [Sediminibacterium sp.]
MQNRLQQLDLFSSQEESLPPAEKVATPPRVLTEEEAPVTESITESVPELPELPATVSIPSPEPAILPAPAATAKPVGKRGRKSFREMDQE